MEKLKIWKTIEIGKIEDYEKALKKAGINISEYSLDLINKMSKNEKESIDLVKMSVKELGFDKNATTSQIFEKIQEIGELVSAEVGVALRLKYPDQNLNEWLQIAMDPISDRDGDPIVFELGRDDGGLWLRSPWAGPGDGWGPDDGFVFRLRKAFRNSETSDSSDLKSLNLRISELENKVERIYKIRDLLD